jgi:hypothetical protein
MHHKHARTAELIDLAAIGGVAAGRAVCSSHG